MTDFSKRWDRREGRGQQQEGWFSFGWLWKRDRKHRILGNVLVLLGIGHAAILLYGVTSYLLSI